MIGRLFSWSVPGKLGRLNSGRNPRRTAITAAALMVGIALDHRHQHHRHLGRQELARQRAEEFHAELIVAGQGSPGMQPTFDGTLLPRMQQLPGVTAVSPSTATRP